MDKFNRDSRKRDVISTPLLLTVLACLTSAVLSLIAVQKPIVLGILIFAVVGAYCLHNYFKVTVVGLLVIRSSLDVFSDIGVPTLFGAGIILLGIGYVTLSFLTKREVNTDKLWWFLIIWVFVQGLWVVLLLTDSLGGNPSQIGNSITQWLKMFSWAVVYLLIMQLKNRTHPKQLINLLMFSLVAPLSAATLQLVLPPSVLPEYLVFSSGNEVIEAGSRLNGTMGHPNSLAYFCMLFLGVTLWKLETDNKKLPWIILAFTLAFFLVSTKSLGGLAMLLTFTFFYVATRLNIQSLISAPLLVGLVSFLFLRSDFGRDRLASLYETPLLNPDLDLSRTLLLAWGDGNSFNWRIAQWTYLIDSWKEFPILGYGLGTIRQVSVFGNYAHNDYIGYLVEGGIIGLILFLLFLGAQFTWLIRVLLRDPYDSTPEQRSFCTILIAFLMGLAVAMLAANVFTTQTTLCFYWFLFLAISNWNWSKDIDLSYSEC